MADDTQAAELEGIIGAAIEKALGQQSAATNSTVATETPVAPDVDAIAERVAARLAERQDTLGSFISDADRVVPPANIPAPAGPPDGELPTDATRWNAETISRLQADPEKFRQALRRYRDSLSGGQGPMFARTKPK